MKIYKKIAKVDFVPVTIVLETDREYQDMLSHIASVQKEDLKGYTDEIIDRIFEFGCEVYRTLNSVKQEGLQR